MAIKLQQLRKWYKDAAKYKSGHRFALMVMELCVEVERLRQIADEQNSEYSDYTIMPFGKYSKPPDGPKKLADVPDDYLEWWFKENGRREVIILEMDYGPYAQRAAALKKLRLHDYIKRRKHDNEIQSDREDDAA